MKIYYPTKTGRGKCCSMYGKGRSVHSMKRNIMVGGYVPLLLSKNLGRADGGAPSAISGAGLPSLKKIEQTKPQMNNVIERLGQLQLQPAKKRKNISFQF